MSFNKDSTTNQKSWRRQVLEMLCCLLFLICVGNPNFHSFCHLVGQSHQHPTGSIYSHIPNSGISSPFLNTCDPFIVNGHSSLGIDSGLEVAAHSTGELASGSPAGIKFTTERIFGSVPESPHRDSDGGEGPFFYIHLGETEACAPATYELFSDVGPPALDDPNFECRGITLAVESGTIGARGPPLCTATRHLPVA